MDRIGKVKAFMEQEGLDAVLVTDRYNVRYFSMFTGDEAYLYISAKSKRAVLMTDSRYTTWAESEVKGFEVFQVDRNTPYEEKVRQLMEEENSTSLGFENTKMIYQDVLKFQEKTPEIIWIPLNQKLDEFRQIKEPEELECLRKAEKIGDAAFSHIINQLTVGITELEVAWEIEQAMRKAGGEGCSFETIAVFGERTAMPHAVPGRRRLNMGDFVVMDFGCIYRGYCSDMTRTVVMGKASQQQKRMYETVLKAQLAALSFIRSGVKGSEVDEVARNIIADAGYGKFFGHGLGHSVGLFIHESPSLSPKDNTVLHKNMVETVEPGIYIPDEGGVRIEDLVIVTEKGCENLTFSPKNLMEL